MILSKMLNNLKNFENVGKCFEKEENMKLITFLSVFLFNSMKINDVVMRFQIPYVIVELYESLARSPWLTVYRALQVAKKVNGTIWELGTTNMVIAFFW